ncbi:CNH domain-containing protein [Hamiltosporidium magnivora]|uniref:CNH domain-containing protein n=1 Tax=Hamiltosporidium magnivora TaxID=148818 RepID=A0A4Q9LL54_9MICR|nr:CNH domain-containing protein [Hamiltosporidium magnivora]
MSNERKRLEALSEIYESEKLYINDLNVWCKDFKKYILSLKSLPPQRKYDLTEAVFSNLESILNLHCRLYEEMTKINIELTENNKFKDNGKYKMMDNNGIDGNNKNTINISVSLELKGIGKEDENVYSNLEYHSIYLENIDTFEIYKYYSGNLSLAEFEMDRELKNNRIFHREVTTFLKEKKISNLGIKHFLYRPSQKMARYDILWKAVLKNEKDEEYKNKISLLIDKFKSVNKIIDGVYGTTNEQFAVFKLSKQLQYKSYITSSAGFCLFQKNRRIIKEGDILVKTDFHDLRLLRVIILDNYILITDLITQPTGDMKYICEDPIPLVHYIASTTKIDEYEEKSPFIKDLFPLYLIDVNGKKIISFYFKETNIRDIYLKDISKAMNEIKSKFIEDISVSKIHEFKLHDIDCISCPDDKYGTKIIAENMNKQLKDTFSQNKIEMKRETSDTNENYSSIRNVESNSFKSETTMGADSNKKDLEHKNDKKENLNPYCEDLEHKNDTMRSEDETKEKMMALSESSKHENETYLKNQNLINRINNLRIEEPQYHEVSSDWLISDAHYNSSSGLTLDETHSMYNLSNNNRNSMIDPSINNVGDKARNEMVRLDAPDPKLSDSEEMKSNTEASSNFNFDTNTNAESKNDYLSNNTSLNPDSTSSLYSKNNGFEKVESEVSNTSKIESDSNIRNPNRNSEEISQRNEASAENNDTATHHGNRNIINPRKIVGGFFTKKILRMESSLRASTRRSSHNLNEARRKEEGFLLISQKNGVYKKYNGEITKIYEKSVKKMIYDIRMDFLIYQQGDTLLVSILEPESTFLEETIVMDDTDTFFYGMTMEKNYIAIKKLSSDTTGSIYLFEVFQNDGYLKIKLYRRLYIGSHISRVEFLKAKLIIACKDFEIVDSDTLRTQELIDPSDPCTPYLFFLLENSYAKNIFKITNTTFLVCFDSIGFFIDSFGHTIQRNIIFSWHCIPTDFKMFENYLVCLSSDHLSIWDVTNANIVFVKYIRGLRFVEGTTKPLLHDKRSLYLLTLPSKKRS